MIKSINIADYTYTLPEKKIAKYPLTSRDSSKLLAYNAGRISHKEFRGLPELIEPGTMLVFNNTKVIQARLVFRKVTGSAIEIFCLEPHEPADYNLAFQKTGSSVWKCLVGNAKKWKSGQLEIEIQGGSKKIRLKADKVGRDKDSFHIQFSWIPRKMSFAEILELAGNTPIPPYLNRDAEAGDRKTYQTLYSKNEGSVAAPTAGLHFTDEVLRDIKSRGLKKLELTLHVGAGTFQPVSANSLLDHPMHAEHFYISRKAVQSLLEHEGKILAIGTTSTRMLESLYWIGSRLGNKNAGPPDKPHFLDQWDAYKLEYPGREQCLENILRHMHDIGSEKLEGLTRMMIVPGYRFRMVDRLLTNFHQPNSTLLLLVAAFIGDDWKKVYDYALRNNFRFLSYGDSSLLIP